MQQLFHGLSAAPGVGIGNVFSYAPAVTDDVCGTGAEGAPLPGGTPKEEWERFLAARLLVDEELARLAQIGQAAAAEIFLVHREILHDSTLTDAVRTAIDSGSDATRATQMATGELVQLFQGLSDEYFASRATDVRDVGQRLVTRLGGITSARQLNPLPNGTILLAEDLTPFDTTHLDQAHVVGIALAASTPTAHTAILARSLGIPLVCSAGSEILQLQNGMFGVVDGIRGRLLVDPDEETLEQYRLTRARLQRFQAEALSHSHEPALTPDGVRIPVRVNVNNRDDLLHIDSNGAEGIGLLRTENLFQHRTSPPTIDEQLAAYQDVHSYTNNHSLTVRLLDIGGDKPVPYLPQPAEANPFLGVRGIRLLLRHPQMLTDQFRALVELAHNVSPVSRIRVLIPMISKVNEVQRALALFEEIPGYKHCRHQLGTLEVGVLIEVPSAALLAHHLAPQVDFLSIGTNDLAQYTLAADRINSSVATLATPLDPSVLRLIAFTCEAGRAAGIPVAICGEVAGDPSVQPLLLGLGLNEISVAGPAVPLVKSAIRRVDMAAAKALAARALQCSRAQEIHQLLHDAVASP